VSLVSLPETVSFPSWRALLHLLTCLRPCLNTYVCVLLPPLHTLFVARPSLFSSPLLFLRYPPALCWFFTPPPLFIAPLSPYKLHHACCWPPPPSRASRCCLLPPTNIWALLIFPPNNFWEIGQTPTIFSWLKPADLLLPIQLRRFFARYNPSQGYV